MYIQLSNHVAMQDIIQLLIIFHNSCWNVTRCLVLNSRFEYSEQPQSLHGAVQYNHCAAGTNSVQLNSIYLYSAFYNGHRHKSASHMSINFSYLKYIHIVYMYMYISLMSKPLARKNSLKGQEEKNSKETKKRTRFLFRSN